MHKNKVVLLLKSLSASEIRQLDKFVRSPVHNRHEEVIRFFQYARKYLNSGERAMQKENVFEYLYPGETFDMQKIHYVNSYLLKVMEEFLAWQEWRKEEVIYQRYLLRAYRQHRQHVQFDSIADKTQKTLENTPYRDVSYHKELYQLELERFNHTRTSTGKQDFRLQELSDAQDIAFVTEKLKNSCILLSNQSTVKTTYNTGLLTQVHTFLENHPYLEIPSVATYYYASQALLNFQDDEAFWKLKKLLSTHRQSFNLLELHDLYIFALNYCIRRSNSGETGFVREVFDIYKMGMETDAFIQNGIISPRTYSNIIMAGLKFNEFDWVEQFIHHYKASLPEKQREGFFNYNLARFYYERKNFKEAMPLLLQMEYEDVLLTVLGKIMLAKMQLELNETEALSSHLQSFKTYVRRKKMLGYHREGALNFTLFTEKLMQKPRPNPAVLREDILRTKVVTEKEWLLERLGG